jgi:hypothetical protein
LRGTTGEAGGVTALYFRVLRHNAEIGELRDLRWRTRIVRRGQGEAARRLLDEAEDVDDLPNFFLPTSFSTCAGERAPAPSSRRRSCRTARAVSSSSSGASRACPRASSRGSPRRARAVVGELPHGGDAALDERRHPEELGDLLQRILLEADGREVGGDERVRVLLDRRALVGAGGRAELARLLARHQIGAELFGALRGLDEIRGEVEEIERGELVAADAPCSWSQRGCTITSSTSSALNCGFVSSAPSAYFFSCLLSSTSTGTPAPCL